MDELIVGIASHFTQQKEGSYHPFCTAIGGKLREGNPRPEDDDTYGTVNFPIDSNMSALDNEINEVVAQFDLYSHSSSSATIGSLYTKLKDWFDDCEAIKDGWAALAVSGYRVQLVDRIAANKFEPDLATDAEHAYWRQSVRYLVTLLKD